MIKKYNKHVFVWIAVMIFGSLGADRFMRGQFLWGLLKLLTLGMGGLWTLIDFIIAVVKAYGGAFGGDRYLTFIYGKYAR